LRRDYGLKPRYDRLRGAGLLTKQELASRLGVGTKTVEAWTHHGILRAHRYDEKNGRLYEDPGPNPPVKSQGLKLRLKDRTKAFFSDKTKEV
jgi:excisionase family DNA binding protein